MAGKYGTKETQELLYATKVAILAVVREAKKDGWQPTDLGAFLKSAEFEAAVGPAVQGAEGVIDELGELDIWDDLVLGKYVYSMVTDIVGELRALRTPKASA